MGMGGPKKKGAISEINVTPLVDVMLVLLVIFMITAPLMLNGIKLSLPKTKEVNRMNLNTKQVIVSMTKQGDLFVGEDATSEDKIVELIQKRFESNKTDIVFLRADYKIVYGKVAKLMSKLKASGIVNISLVTEIEAK